MPTVTHEPHTETPLDNADADRQQKTPAREIAGNHATLAELRAHIESPAIDVVSTDVFDTLVWRRVAKPVDAFEVIGQRLAARNALAESLTAAAFGNLRRVAEEIVRHRYSEKHGSTEIRLSEIYEFMPASTFAPLSHEQAIAEEINTERDLIVPDLDVVDLLVFAHEQGKRVIAVSDTYFSADHLRRLLDQPVLDAIDFENIFTSSDYRDNKSGSLFDLALRSLGVPAERVVHVGDNQHADIDPAERRDIRTIFLERCSDRLEQIFAQEERLGRNLTTTLHKQTQPQQREIVETDFGLTALRTKMEHRLEMDTTPSHQQRFWRFGATVYGPVLTGFAEWIHEKASSLGTDRVFCLMREGAFLTRLLSEAGSDREIPLAQPLWANRSICGRAAIGGATREELSALFWRRTPPTMKDFCSMLGVRISDLPSLAGHADTRLEDPILRELILDELTAEGPIRDQIIANAQALRERFVAYLEKTVGDTDPLVIVDLGWGATIQDRLVATLKQAGVKRRVVGLYLMTHEAAAYAISRGSELEGYLANLGSPKPLVKNVLRSAEVLEQTCMPNHGAQCDISPLLEPVLEENGSQSPAQYLESGSIRNGILAFQREYLRYQRRIPGKLTPLSNARTPFRSTLLRAVAVPTQEETAMFARWQHDENNGSDESSQLCSDSHKHKLRHITPQQLPKHSLSDVYWPFGLARQHDPHLAELVEATTAGVLSTDATSTPLETGRFTVEAVSGVGTEGSPKFSDIPRRNRWGLSFVSTTLQAGSIDRVEILPGEKPFVMRIDWLDLRLWIQGQSEPQTIRLEDPQGFDLLSSNNILHLSPNLFIATNAHSGFAFEPKCITPRPVFRIDVELAFASFASSTLLPGPGSPAAMISAEKQLQKLRRLVRPWRVFRRRS